jgi:hypothetical protein
MLLCHNVFYMVDECALLLGQEAILAMLSGTDPHAFPEGRIHSLQGS